MKDALDLIVHNLRETETNCKKTFAKWKLGLELDEFSKQLLDLWANATADNQERLAIAFPQIAEATLEYIRLKPTKQKKYLEKLLNIRKDDEENIKIPDS